MAGLRELWSKRQNRQVMLWGFGVLGVLVLILGVFTFFSAWNDVHSHTERIEEFPHNLADADDATLLLVEAHQQALAEAIQHRQQSVLILGGGLFLLGIAYLTAPGKEAAINRDGRAAS